MNQMTSIHDSRVFTSRYNGSGSCCFRRSCSCSYGWNNFLVCSQFAGQTHQFSHLFQLHSYLKSRWFGLF